MLNHGRFRLHFMVVFLSFLSAGCAVFPRYKTPKLNGPLTINPCPTNTPLFISTNYNADQPLPDRSTPKIFSKAVEAVSKETSACFTNVTVSTRPYSGPGVKVEMDLRLHNNIAKEMAAGFVAGFTFLTIPVWCTYPFTLTSRLIDSNGMEVDRVVLKDDIRLWMHALFLFYPKTAGSATMEMSENMVRTAFQKLDWSRLASITPPLINSERSSNEE